LNSSALRELSPGISLSREEWFRIVAKEHASEIDEIAHTILHSWRYNPRGEFGVLYLSSSPECAYREKLKQVSGRAQDLPPQVVGKFSVKIERCLDLTREEVREKIRVTLEDLTRPDDFSLTQTLAREARRVGFHALLVPSAVGKDCLTLVVFKDRLEPPAYCTCIESKEYKP